MASQTLAGLSQGERLVIWSVIDMARRRKKPPDAAPPPPATWPAVVFRPPPIDRPKPSATTAVTVYRPPPRIAAAESPVIPPVSVQIPEVIVAEVIERIEPRTGPLPRLMIQLPGGVGSPDPTAAVAQLPPPVSLIESKTPKPPRRPAVVLDDGRRIEFGHRVLIGRAPVAGNAADIGSMIALPESDRSVSNTHLRVEVFAAGPYVTDVGSATGVALRYPNGMTLPTLAGMRTPVEPGCTVLFGHRSLQISVPESIEP